MTRPIYICLAADNQYSNLAEVAMVSVFENNKSSERIIVYLLDSGISKKRLCEIHLSVQKYGRELEIIDVTKRIEELKQIGVNAQSKNFSFGAYARFFVVNYLPEFVDKILYIDCDICVNDSLNELFKIEIQDYVMAAVIDILPSSHLKHIGFSINEPYFNSGMLLINISEWKAEKIETKILEHIKYKRCIYSYHDQDLINIICRNKIYTLDPKYMVFLPEYYWGANKLRSLGELGVYYSTEKIRNAANKPTLIHFVDNIWGRPWYTSQKNPNSRIWEKYKEKINNPDEFEYTVVDCSIQHKLARVISKTSFNALLQKYVMNKRRVQMVSLRDFEADEQMKKINF